MLIVAFIFNIALCFILDLALLESALLILIGTPILTFSLTVISVVGYVLTGAILGTFLQVTERILRRK